VRQHGWERTSGPAPRIVRTILRLFGRRDARCVGPTSAFSRSSYEHSRLVGSRRTSSRLRAARHSGIRLLHGRAIRFGGSLAMQTGVLVPIALRDDRTSDTPVAALMMRCRSRGQPTGKSRRDRVRTHPRETMRAETRSEMPSVVQGPSPRSILSNTRLRTFTGSRLCHRDPASRRLFRLRGLLRALED